MRQHKQGMDDQNFDKDVLLRWKRQIAKKLSLIRKEWQRTEFFKEGGHHAINHNIRPQQQFAIPKKYVVFVLGALILGWIMNKYPDDVTESNVYFKSLKDNKSENNISSDN